MANKDKYEKIFMDIFEISESELIGLEYRSIKQWDSVGHMRLIAALEEAFDIMMDTEDIIDLNAFEKGKEILKKYDLEIG